MSQAMTPTGMSVSMNPDAPAHAERAGPVESFIPSPVRSVTNGAARLAAIARTPALPRHPWYLPLKTAIEWLGALVLAPVVLPLIALFAALVKLTSKGPVFYHQTRLGLNGRQFQIHKIRTMTPNCEAQTGPRWSQPGDPRVTPIGRLLRDTHMDELPQLINILRGDMTLIGPRPERPEIAERLEEHFPRYRDRLRVRPGITGLAQMQLPSESELPHAAAKLACDLYYVRHVNPWLDFRIAICTPLYLVQTVARRLGEALVNPYGNAASTDRVEPNDTLEARQS